MCVCVCVCVVQEDLASQQGGLFGFSSEANVMNQPLADAGEKLRMAQRMVEDYLQGRVPPPPQFDAP